MPRPVVPPLLAAGLLAAGAAAARPAAGQIVPPLPGGNAGPLRARNVVTVSPAHLLFGAFAADYEYAVRRDLTLGLAGSYTGANAFAGRPRGGSADRDVSAAVRYYLSESAPVGTSLGVTAGALVAERTRDAGAGPATRRVTAPTLGFTADFNQTFGRARRLVFGTGTGIRRRFVGTGAASEGVDDVQWTFRLNVGYAW